MHKVTEFFDLAHISGTHFAYEYLMRRLKELSDRNDNAHRSVIALRRDQHPVPLSQKCLKVELDACLAVASRYADYRQVRVFIQYALGVIYIVVVDALFDRTVDSICPLVEMELHSRYEGHEAARRESCESLDAASSDYENQHDQQHEAYHDVRRHHPLHSWSELQRFLGVHLFEKPVDENYNYQRDPDEDICCYAEPWLFYDQRPGNTDKSQACREAQYPLQVSVAAEPFILLSVDISVQLEHMHIVAQRQPHRRHTQHQ